VRGLEIAEDNGFPYASAVCRGTLGHARARLGRVTEGIAFIRQGLTHLKELGSSLGVTFRWNTLAAAQERAGSIAEALETINQVPRTNPHEVVHRPETLRIRGELRLKQGQADMAEADFREAIAVAQNIGARAWELRATVSLARLLASQACDDEAHMILAEIYNWFTEGFDTADLKEAKALLEELGSPVA